MGRVVAGAILAISAVWWIPYYPIWSLMYAGLGVLLIYGRSSRMGPRLDVKWSSFPDTFGVEIEDR